MANKFSSAVAMIAIALASTQNISAEMIKSLAGQCDVDETTVSEIVNEVMSAKAVAESDMATANS